MKIAVIGTGISGLTAASRLHPKHDITIFEAAHYVGGHTHTHEFERWGMEFAVDTGFIVFNDRNYPHFLAMLGELDVPWRDTDMSFSVRCERRDFEYRGTNLNTFFGQRRNLFSPSFYRLFRDILRFNRQASAMLATGSNTLGEMTLGELLRLGGFGPELRDDYLVPMAAAIWSNRPDDILRFPALYFLQFFGHHGLLTVNSQPQWRTIIGGSRVYVDRLIKPFRERIRLNCPVQQVARHEDRVLVTSEHGTEAFDQVVVATHSDQALAMLADPTATEMEVLGAIPYQSNEAALHVDRRMLPKRRRVWSAWNYHLMNKQADKQTVTYNMNMLQGIQAPSPICITLNRTEDLDPDSIVRVFEYDHPVFGQNAVNAQARWTEINGVRRTWYCGAYWGWGFHEDGVNSALAVIEQFEQQQDHNQQSVSRVG